MDNSDSAIVAIVADTHINSTVGLCPRRVKLDDGGTYHPSKGQRALWSAWLEFWESVFAQATKIDAQVYAVINGDLNDLNVHDGTGLITKNRSDIIRMTVDALEPVMAADHIFIIRGTEAHVGRRANLEEEVAKDLNTEPDAQAGTHSWWWLKLNAAGVLFDIAHHPQTFSRRPWTLDAAPNRHAAIIRDEYQERGEKVPDVAVRAHVHKYVPGNRRLKPQFFYCFPWLLTTAHARRLGATEFETIGGLVFTCQDSQYTFEPESWRPYALKRKIWSAP